MATGSYAISAINGDNTFTVTITLTGGGILTNTLMVDAIGHAAAAGTAGTAEKLTIKLDSTVTSIDATVMSVIGTKLSDDDITLVEINMIESGVVTVQADTFKDLTDLKHVSFSSALTTIGSNAFSGCTSLTESLFWSSTTPTIDSTAFTDVPLEIVNVFGGTQLLLNVGENLETLTTNSTRAGTFFGSVDADGNAISILIKEFILFLDVQLTTLAASAVTGNVSLFSAPIPTFNNVDATLTTAVSVSDASNLFKFNSDSTIDDGDANNVPTFEFAAGTAVVNGSSFCGGFYKVDDADPPPETFDLQDSVTTVAGKGRAAEKWVQTLALSMFGSTGAVDMITNENGTINAFGAAINACSTSVRTTLQDDPGAARDVYAALLSKSDTKKRFALTHNAGVTGVATPGDSYAKDADVTIYNCVVANTTNDGGVGAGGKATVVIERTSEGGANPAVYKVLSIVMVDKVTTDVEIGSAVSFTEPAGGTGAVIRIDAINSVQAAMINDTLADHTSLPFEAGDKLRLKYTVSSNGSQTNVNGDTISTSIDVGVIVNVIA